MYLSQRSCHHPQERSCINEGYFHSFYSCRRFAEGLFDVVLRTPFKCLALLDLW